MLGQPLVVLNKTGNLIRVHQACCLPRCASGQLVLLLETPAKNTAKRGCLQHDPGVHPLVQRQEIGCQEIIDIRAPGGVRVLLTLQLIDRPGQLRRSLGPGAQAPPLQQHEIERACDRVPFSTRPAVILRLVESRHGHTARPRPRQQRSQRVIEQPPVVGAGHAASCQQRVHRDGQFGAPGTCQVKVVQ